MLLFRVDNRLVHGQIIEAWLPYTHAKHLVIANDSLTADHLRQQIIGLAIPTGVQIYFLKILELPSFLQKFAHEKILVILENCSDLEHALKQNMPTPRINIGNLHFAEGKKQLLPHVALNQQELEILKEISKKFIVDFRALPTEKPRGIHEL